MTPSEAAIAALERYELELTKAGFRELASGVYDARLLVSEVARRFERADNARPLRREWPEDIGERIQELLDADGIDKGDPRTRAVLCTARSMLRWKDGFDTPLPEDPAIEAAFPTRSGRHDTYAEAMRLVGARHSKGGLVELVNWLLVERERASSGLEELREEVKDLREASVIEGFLSRRIAGGRLRLSADDELAVVEHVTRRTARKGAQS